MNRTRKDYYDHPGIEVGVKASADAAPRARVGFGKWPCFHANRAEVTRTPCEGVGALDHLDAAHRAGVEVRERRVHARWTCGFEAGAVQIRADLGLTKTPHYWIQAERPSSYRVDSR